VGIGFWWGNLRERGHLEDLGVDGRILLEEILKKLVERALTGLIWHGVGTDSSEHSNEPVGSVNCGNFLTSCGTVSFSRRTCCVELLLLLLLLLLYLKDQNVWSRDAGF
jgi:hypothetical protein